MKLFEVNYCITCDDLKFHDTLLIPAKNVATATKLFEAIPQTSRGLIGSHHKMKILYSFADCKLEIVSVKPVSAKSGTESTGPK
jgi:hypothetical protein